MRAGAAPVGGGTLRARWVTVATQKVSEAMEANLFNGNSALGAVDEQGNLRTVVGYTTHTSRNQVTTAGAWTTFEDVSTDFEAMKSALRNDFFQPPYMVYVGDDVWTLLQRRNLSGSERTQLEILLMSRELIDIKHTFDLAVDEMLMIALHPDVIQFVQSAEIQASDWEAMGIFGNNVRLYGIGINHVKATYGGRSGVAHITSIA